MRFEDFSGFFWGAGNILLSTSRQEHTPKTKMVEENSKRGANAGSGGVDLFPGGWTTGLIMFYKEMTDADFVGGVLLMLFDDCPEVGLKGC